MVDVFLNGGSVITKGTVKGARMNTSLVNIVCVKKVTISVAVVCVCLRPKSVMATMIAETRAMKPPVPQMELPVG